MNDDQILSNRTYVRSSIAAMLRELRALRKIEKALSGLQLEREQARRIAELKESQSQANCGGVRQ